MFSFGERLGMLFPIIGGCLSAISASLILLLGVLRWLRRTPFSWGRSKRSPDACDNIIFLNLMLADLIQATGQFPIIRWMLDGVITEGRLCTAQAVIKQVGSDGVALSSLAIAVYTFCVLVLRRGVPRYISKLVVFIIWVFIALVISIPYIHHTKERFYGDAGYWCWVRAEFKTDQLVTEYLWLWISLFLMTILYTIMFIVMRGWFGVDNGVWYKNIIPSSGAGQPSEVTQEEQDSKVVANLLLLYPAVYLVCILPYSIARWRLYSGFKVPYQYTLATAAVFSLSGIFNGILFFLTRPHLVVSVTDTLPPAPAMGAQIQSAPKEELTNANSWKFGSLPSPRSASDDLPPDVERDTSTQLQPGHNAMSLTKGTNDITLAPHLRIASDSGSSLTYLSGERNPGGFRSMHFPAAPVEEEL